MQSYRFALNGSYDFAGQMYDGLHACAQKYFSARADQKKLLQLIADFERRCARVKLRWLEAMEGRAI